jgi:hypothetical protein
MRLDCIRVVFDHGRVIWRYLITSKSILDVKSTITGKQQEEDRKKIRDEQSFNGY